MRNKFILLPGFKLNSSIFLVSKKEEIEKEE
jgi:hypothetical protein